MREWQDWNPRDTRQQVEAAGLAADVHYDISAVAGELVTYETWFQFDGARDPVVVPDTLRFMDQARVAAFLAEAGLAQVTWYGDWDGSPYGPASPEIIAVASGDRPASRGAADASGPHPGLAEAAPRASARPSPWAWPSSLDLTSLLSTLPTLDRGRSAQTSTCLGAFTLPSRPLTNARSSSPGTS